MVPSDLPQLDPISLMRLDSGTDAGETDAGETDTSESDGAIPDTTIVQDAGADAPVLDTGLDAPSDGAAADGDMTADIGPPPDAPPFDAGLPRPDASDDGSISVDSGGSMDGGLPDTSGSACGPLDGMPCDPMDGMCAVGRYQCISEALVCMPASDRKAPGTPCGDCSACDGVNLFCPPMAPCLGPDVCCTMSAMRCGPPGC